MKYTKPELQFVGSGSELILALGPDFAIDSVTQNPGSTYVPGFSLSAE